MYFKLECILCTSFNLELTNLIHHAYTFVYRGFNILTSHVGTKNNFKTKQSICMLRIS